MPSSTPVAKPARRTMRLQTIETPGSATSALVGAGLTMAAVIASALAFAAI